MDQLGYSHSLLSIIFNDISVCWLEAEISISKSLILIILFAKTILLFDKIINLVESSLKGQNKLCIRPKKVSSMRIISIK